MRQPHDERVCREDGCETVLSYLNPTDRCAVHGGWMQAIDIYEQRRAFQDVMVDDS